MANTQGLRRRIRSVKSTQQITKAMKMVAAARLRRAQSRILEARPYATCLDAVLGVQARATVGGGWPRSLPRRRLEPAPMRLLTGSSSGGGGLTASTCASPAATSPT